MRTNPIRRTVLATLGGLAVVGSTALGAGAAFAGGDTTGPKPGAPICGTTGINGEPRKTVPCSRIPAAGAAFTLDADGTVRDGDGKIVGKYDPKTGSVTGGTGVPGNGAGIIVPGAAGE